MSRWIMKVPVLCSWHLTLATSRDIITGKYEDLCVAPYDAGMFILVGHDPIPEGFPADLQGIIRWAKECRCDWVRFDAIGETIDLPTYKDTWS